MLECIGPDLWEEALLRPMDFGHSFSRTLEADERFKLRHGEAVAIDCVMSTMIAEAKGLLPSSDAQGLLDLYAVRATPHLHTPSCTPHRAHPRAAVLVLLRTP